MKTKRWVSIGALLIFMIPMMVMGQMGPRHEMKMEKLGLNAEQQTQLEQLATAHHKDMIQLHAEAKIARIELNEAINSGASEKEVGKKVDVVNAAQKALLQAKTHHHLEVRDVIGTEKFSLWMNMRGGHKAGKCGMMGSGKGHGMHPGKGMGDGQPRWQD